MKLLITIIERGKGEDVTDLISKYKIDYNIIFLGQGTATSSMLDYFSLTNTDKDVVLSLIDDGDEDIKALIKYCKQVPCKVNLIQYNPIGEGKFDHRSVEAEEKYVRELEKAGITALVRRSRGGDIDAACGQLANKNSGE